MDSNKVSNLVTNISFYQDNSYFHHYGLSKEKIMESPHGWHVSHSKLSLFTPTPFSKIQNRAYSITSESELTII